jgi:hypothetical protein
MIKPEGGSGTIVDFHVGNGAKGVELIVDDVPEEAIGPSGGSVKGCSVTQKPVLPVGLIAREQLVDELHKQLGSSRSFTSSPPFSLDA